MSIKSVLFLLLIFMALSEIAKGQYFQFSQYNFTEQRINPTQLAFYDYAMVTLDYRHQKVADNFNIQSAFLSSNYTFRRKKGARLGIGISLLDDRAGEAGIFRTTMLGLNIASAIPIAKSQWLGMGVKTGWSTKSVSLDNFTTGSQFVSGRGFIGGSSGENMEQFKRQYITWSAGAMWEKKDPDGYTHSSFGTSLYNFNQPNESLMGDDSKMPASIIINGAVRVIDKVAYSLTPDLLLTHTASLSTWMVGVKTSFKMDFVSKYEGLMHLITRYNPDGYGVAGLQFENKKYEFGISYDIPISGQVGNLGTIEIAARLKHFIEPLPPSRRNKKLKYPKRKSTSKKLAEKRRLDVLAARQKTEEKDMDEVNEALNEEAKEDKPIVEERNLEQNNKVETEAHLGDFKHIRLDEPIYFNFNFEVNAAKLSDDDKKVLDDLVLLLTQNPFIIVSIEGHTDDTGHYKYNQQLSERRAGAVADYLIQNGIDNSRINYKGYGETKPLLPNNNEENRSKNRRVEFVLHESKTK